jgi:hypothetical protein
MPHVIKTTIVTDSNGSITGYGFAVEAETEGDAQEIQAVLCASLDMIRAALAARFAIADDESSQRRESERPSVTDQATPAPAEAQAPAGPPATPAEARQRFFVRYGEIVGGSGWADVQRYLRRPRAAEPTSVRAWDRRRRGRARS